MGLLIFSIKYEWLYRLLGITLCMVNLLLTTAIDGGWAYLPLLIATMLVAGAYKLSQIRQEYKKRNNGW